PPMARRVHRPAAALCHDRGVLGPFRYVIWLAVAVSIGVYGYRAYQRWVAPDRGDGTDSPGSTPSADSPSDATKGGMGFRDPRTVVSDPSAEPTESLVQSVIREELARKGGGDGPALPAAAPAAPAAGAGDAGGSTRGGLFAATPGERADKVS